MSTEHDWYRPLATLYYSTCRRCGCLSDGPLANRPCSGNTVEDEPRKRSGITVGRLLCKAFGLDPNQVTRIELVCALDAPTVLNVTMVPAVTNAGMSELVEELKTFEVVPPCNPL